MKTQISLFFDRRSWGATASLQTFLSKSQFYPKEYYPFENFERIFMNYISNESTLVTYSEYIKNIEKN